MGIWHIYYKDVEQLDHTIVSTLMATLDGWDRDKDLPIATIEWDGVLGILTDRRYRYTEVNHTPLVRFENMSHPANDIYNDYRKFDTLLKKEDTTVQKALERLEKYAFKSEVLTGAVDGANKVFSTSVPYVAGSIVVYRCGLECLDFAEISDTEIEMTDAPSNVGFTDLISATFIKKPLLN